MDTTNPIQNAEDAGFDISLIEINLSLSPDQRAELHQKALDLVWELEKAGLNFDEKSK